MYRAEGYDQQVRAASSVLDGDAGVLIEALQENGQSIRRT